MTNTLRIAALAAALMGTTLSAGNAWAATYDIDPVHSGIRFSIDHLGFSRVFGMATEFSGTFEFDPANPQAGALSVSVKTASIFTNNPQRDSDIQGADWFNSTEFPEITFVGTAFTRINDTSGMIAGDLTIAGVTNPVMLDVVFINKGENPWSGDQVVGFGARTVINRSDFGMSAALGMIGDEVILEIQVEGREVR